MPSFQFGSYSKITKTTLIEMMQTKNTTKSYANDKEEIMNDAKSHLPIDNISSFETSFQNYQNISHTNDTNQIHNKLLCE